MAAVNTVGAAVDGRHRERLIGAGRYLTGTDVIDDGGSLAVI